MRSNYKKIGPYLRQVDVRNVEDKKENLLGVSTQKVFIDSIANTVGTDFRTYKVVKRRQFTYVADTSRRGDRIGIALLDTHNEGLVSPIYTVFEITDHDVLLPEYLMMWFRRPEFDRYARFKSHGSVREMFDWDEMCDVELPMPSIEKQRDIVKEYHTIVDRIKLNERLNQKLEETAQAVFREWFVDETGDEKTNLGNYISFNPKHSIAKNKITTYIEMADVQERYLSITGTIERPFSSGSKFKNNDTLLARITPCLENGKTAFVDCLRDEEIAYGSTEFIVMRAKKRISPYWVYCLAREEDFRSYAISSMVGSSGRQRVHSDYLEVYQATSIDYEKMEAFHIKMKPIFTSIQVRSRENQKLELLRQCVLSGISTK